MLCESQHIKIEEFNSREKVNLYLMKNNIVDTLHHVGDVICFSSTVLKQCKVKNIDHQHITVKNKTVSFPLSIQFSNCSLTVSLSSLSCSVIPFGTTTLFTATVTTTTYPGVCTIHCSPVTHGHHEVNVQVNDVQVDDTLLVIPFNSYLDNITPIHTIPELKRP